MVPINSPETSRRWVMKAARIHGDRTQSQRNEALRGFQQGNYRVLVATDVAARGIHVDGISHVVNYDLPQVPEDFIHRVGRTARAGGSGTASTFAPVPASEIRKIEKTLRLLWFARKSRRQCWKERSRPRRRWLMLQKPQAKGAAGRGTGKANGRLDSRPAIVKEEGAALRLPFVELQAGRSATLFLLSSVDQP